MIESSSPPMLSRCDWLLLAAFCLLLFGFAMFDGRPLSLHSARLPETAREMMRSHDWLVPRSGGRPWLERPPLPHWIMIALSAALGQHCDRVWVVRLPSALMGTCAVLLTAWVASVGFGRSIALLSGYALALGFEFYTYSTLSEDDIYLAAIVAAIMALFVRCERDAITKPTDSSPVLGLRSWPMLLFFVLLGLSNWVKSPLVGMASVLPPIGVYLLGIRRWPAIQKYVWFWGLLICVALTVLWPYLIYRRYPATMRNWLFDYSETDQYDQPFWYYPPVMMGLFMPTTLAVLVGLWASWREALRSPGSMTRLIWCWAIVPVIVFSIPHRKHHHYLVPSLAPWGILAGIGLARVGRWIGERRGAAIVFGCAVTAIAIGYCIGQIIVPDSTGNDTAFLRAANAAVPADALLTIDSDLGGEMDFFRNQFYVRPTARLLHNLSFLQANSIHEPTVYVITRADKESKLQELGDVRLLIQSTKTRREKSPADRFTLFALTFKPDLKRYPAPPADSITTKQAMDRDPGPWCGPPL